MAARGTANSAYLTVAQPVVSQDTVMVVFGNHRDHHYEKGVQMTKVDCA
jgi:hypothetical protein